MLRLSARRGARASAALLTVSVPGDARWFRNFRIQSDRAARDACCDACCDAAAGSGSAAAAGVADNRHRGAAHPQILREHMADAAASDAHHRGEQPAQRMGMCPRTAGLPCSLPYLSRQGPPSSSSSLCNAPRFNKVFQSVLACTCRLAASRWEASTKSHCRP